MKQLILTLFLALVLFSGCKTIEVIKEVPVIVKEYVQRVDTFTLVTNDSVYIHQKGDTVFSERFRTVFRDRIKIRVDSIPYPVEVKEVSTKIEKVPVEVPIRDVFWWLGVLILLYGFIRLVLFLRKKIVH